MFEIYRKGKLTGRSLGLENGENERVERKERKKIYTQKKE